MKTTVVGTIKSLANATREGSELFLAVAMVGAIDPFRKLLSEIFAMYLILELPPYLDGPGLAPCMQGVLGCTCVQGVPLQLASLELAGSPSLCDCHPVRKNLCWSESKESKLERVGP